MPKVSIIVPTYNVEKYLVECMESIVNQTLQDIEIICVDDGSTDNSGKILDEYAVKDSRIKVIHKENGGYGKAMNVGLENATGEYIGIVEPDDYVELNMYEELYKIAHEKNLDLIKADFNRFVGKGSNLQLYYNQLDKTEENYHIIINPKKNTKIFDFIMNTWCGIYKREFLEKHHIRHNETPGASYQDNGFWFQTFIFAERVYFVNKPYYMNRRDNPNSSVKDKGKVYAMKHEYDFIYKFFENNPELKKFFIYNYYKAKFTNYTSTLKRVHKFLKKEFLNVFAQEFRTAVDIGEIDVNLFDPEGNLKLAILLKDPNKFLKKTLNNKSLLEKIFSVRNNIKTCHKVITICGLQIKIKSKKMEYEQRFTKLTSDIDKLNSNTNNRFIKITEEIRPFLIYKKLKKMNKEKVLSEMENNIDYYGITKEKRDTKLIVSLTSFPERMYDIHYNLYSLLNQSVKPDEIILWLALEQFPNKEDDIPQKVLNLTKHGLRIEFTNDMKSYKKLIPSLKNYSSDIIITADDDIYYSKDWLEKLYNEYLQNPDCIIAHRCHRVTFDLNKNIAPYTKWEKEIEDDSSSTLNFFTGAGGVLYPPNSLCLDVLNEELFINLAPNADDIWFWAMALLNNKKIKVVNNPINKLIYINPEREIGFNGETTLYSQNKVDNDKQLMNIINEYPQIINMLESEYAKN